eukprot:CAMPEP_0182441124 /NCGR_PEP_ID=MMETSP1172-20130603/67_1 /TAXON_ID=708627 /ORGANISM="Timspurckia oligopyrenoides, Strain CCMP3278" /LENGTH=432 /DNA_ID=CAMNT_0024635277 /DNA_START=41 /DNA_END=1339 /DNA_ORIENTATION=+
MVWGMIPGESRIDGWTSRILRQDPGFRRLYVIGNRSVPTHDWVRLFKAIEGTSVLLELGLSGVPLEASAVEALANALILNRSLRVLAVGDQSFNDYHLSILSEGLVKNSSLRDLDLRNKLLTSVSSFYLAKVFGAAENSDLKILRLSGNCIESVGLNALVNFQTTFGLEELYVDSCGIKDSTDIFCQTLSDSFPELRVLSISRNPLNKKSWQLLAQSIKTVTFLRTFEAVDSNLEAEEAQALLLNSGSFLKSLSLGSNKIGTFVLDSFLREKAVAQMLETLDFRACELNDEFMLQFSQCSTLGLFPKLSSLILSDNQVSSFGINRIECLGIISSLALFNNPLLGPGAADALIALSKRVDMRNLKNIDIGACKIEIQDLLELGSNLSSREWSHLEELCVAANPGCNDEKWKVTNAELRITRPDLDVIWTLQRE